MRCSICLAPMEKKEPEEGKTILECTECNYSVKPAPAKERCPECNGPLFWNGSYKRLGKVKVEQEKEAENAMDTPIVLRYSCVECGERFMAIYALRKFVKRASLARVLKSITSNK